MQSGSGCMEIGSHKTLITHHDLVQSGCSRTTIKELYDEATTNGGSATLIYKVRNGLEISQGELKLSCSFGEKEIIEPTSEWKRILIGGGGLILLHIAVAATCMATSHLSITRMLIKS